MKSIISSIMISVLFFCHFLWIPIYGENRDETEKELDLYAQSAVLIDADSGRVLYGKNENLQRPMASTTKIMTCILALEYGKEDDIVTVSAYAAQQPKVHLGTHTGETFYLKDLLYSLMLESHNDTAVMIGEHIGGSVEKFAEMMNRKAGDIGCNDTYFITPNGLDASAVDKNGVNQIHSTTAEDLAQIMRYCIEQSPKRAEFLEITAAQNHYFMDIEGNHSFQCSNHNAFLTMMSGALSGKTGFTGEAGYSYVGALKDGNRTFIVALLGCGWPPHKSYKWSDTRTLMKYGLDHYRYQDVWETIHFAPIFVENGISVGDDISEPVTVNLTVATSNASLPILLKEAERVEIRCQVERNLKAPVQVGQIVGTVNYTLNGEIVKTCPVITMQSVDKITISWCIRKIIQLYFYIDHE